MVRQKFTFYLVVPQSQILGNPVLEHTRNSRTYEKFGYESLKIPNNVTETA